MDHYSFHVITQRELQEAVDLRALKRQPQKG